MTNTASSPVLATPLARPDGSTFGLEIETLDYCVQVIHRSYGESTREFNKKTRVYGAHAAFVPNFSADEKAAYTAIPDLSVRDRSFAAFQRASTRIAKAGLLGALPDLAAALRSVGQDPRGFDVEGAVFSRNAGCAMCACSPGFVLPSVLMVNYSRVDLHFSSAA